MMALMCLVTKATALSKETQHSQSSLITFFQNSHWRAFLSIGSGNCFACLCFYAPCNPQSPCSNGRYGDNAALATDQSTLRNSDRISSVSLTVIRLQIPARDLLHTRTSSIRLS